MITEVTKVIQDRTESEQASAEEQLDEMRCSHIQIRAAPFLWLAVVWLADYAGMTLDNLIQLYTDKSVYIRCLSPGLD